MANHIGKIESKICSVISEMLAEISLNSLSVVFRGSKAESCDC